MTERKVPELTDLLETTETDIPPAGTSRLFADITTGRVSGRDDKGADAFQDFRRVRGEELRHWRSALGGRELAPVNLYMVGDSILMGGGASTYQRTWADSFRDAMQREYRPGGEGLIPAYNPAAPWANRWTLAGTPTITDFGTGWGRRAVFLDTTDDTCTITSVCDRFYILFAATPTSGTFKVVIDGGAPATQSCASAISMSGRVYDSGQLTLGSHTIVVSPNAASNLMFIEGIVLFATDASLGVRFFNGGHGGERAEHLNGDTTEDGTAVGCRRNWAQLPFQPKTLVLSGAASLSSDGATPSTLTWTGASPSLVTADIGEVIFAGTDTAFPRGVRVVSVSSGTVCIVNKAVPAGTYTAAMTRSKVTDATTTINTVNVSSPTIAFTSADLGKTIAPSSQFIAGTVIKRIVSATAIEIYPVAIASSAGAGTLQILNRQALPLRPDLFIEQFGGNDMFAGIPKAEFKANMRAISTVLEEVAQLDIPTMTGIYNDERPSVATMGMWTTGYRADCNLVVSTTSGLPDIAKATTGLVRELRFTSADVGKGCTSTAWTGTLTINSVSADGNSAVLSGNATSTQTNVAALMLQRQFVDSQYQDYRAAQFELAIENDWTYIDLYDIGGAAGIYDYQQLIGSDGLHPSDRGAQWICDEMSTMFGGVKKLASIPQGIFNNKGEIIAATAADTASVLMVGASDFQLTADSTASSGLKWAPALVSSRNTVSQSIGGTVLTNVTGLSFPVVSANAVYAFEAFLNVVIASSAAASQGLGLAITVPTSATLAATITSATNPVAVRNTFFTAAATAQRSLITSNGFTGLVRVAGTVTASTATSHTGTVQIQIQSAASTASTTSNTATVQNGAWIQAVRLV